MRNKHLVTIFVLLALSAPASPAHAGGVVNVCDETHLRSALSGGGTVTFACSDTIILAGTLTIAANTTIDGAGQAVTLSGNHVVRVFGVNPGATLTLNRLTVANGACYDYEFGAGIANAGTLIVSNSTFIGNVSGRYASGGAIYNTGTVTVSASTFSTNGTGIYGYGAGIYNNGSGTVDVRNSTFSGNTAGWSGGGIANLGLLTVSNATFAANSAGFEGGGIDNYGGIVTISNSTFSGNGGGGGGGINNPYGTVTLNNTIVANSAGGSNCAGAIVNGGGNLSYPDATCPGINSNPFLGPLQNNGGPSLTMTLGPGSAALDAANDAICAAAPVNNRDQRGIPRPLGLHCDIGALEAYCPNFVPPAVVGVEDIVAIAQRWGWTNSTPGWDPAYDFNRDNMINILDITLVTAAWNRTCS